MTTQIRVLRVFQPAYKASAGAPIQAELPGTKPSVAAVKRERIRGASGEYLIYIAPGEGQNKSHHSLHWLSSELTSMLPEQGMS